MLLLPKKIKLYASFGLQFANWQFDYLRYLSNYKIIHCLGDSHTHLFQDIERRRLMNKTIIRSVKVGGATAAGIANINSVTKSLRIFQRYIRFIKKKSYILFMLGEVDCGYLIWHRAKKHNTSVESQLQRSIENYQNFIIHLIDEGYHNLILSSAPLPAILDEKDWGDLDRSSKDITPTYLQRQNTQPIIRERTDLTIEYNNRLRIFCNENAISFLDFEQDTLNQQTNLIDNCYRQANPSDNHLETDMVLPIIVKKMRSLGFE